MKSILLVEDTVALANEIQELLEMENYNVVKAQNGVEALHVLKSNTPDIIITDLLMPEMNGIELVSNIKNDPGLSHIPIILLTAKAEPETTNLVNTLGIQSLLRKPCRAEEFLHAVERLQAS